MKSWKWKLERFFDPKSGRAVLLPLDHGVSEGSLPGFENPKTIFDVLKGCPIQGVILHRGMAQAYLQSIPPRLGLILHLSAGTRHGIPPYAKALVCSVPEALRAGADAVSVHVNIGNDFEDRMLADFGMVVEDAHQLGLPVLAMIYARGGQIVNESDSSLVAHCIRLGAEIGADLIKVPYSGHKESFSRAVEHCPVPVIVAGGPRQADFASFQAQLCEIMETGVRGVSIGRNIFQQTDPKAALESVVKIVHGGANQ
ncbi:MAG: fructose-bisphosphate aldolase [Deltaproteobacteria bacterium]|nr:fructose-bisphosphate aldolase [Deltaproteobacteria bacterium]